MRLAICTLLVSSAFAQNQFEVASVKALKSDGGRFTMTGGPGTSDPSRITYSNIPLRIVLLNAYDFRNYPVTGPDWLNTLRFDINAKLPEGTTKEQLQAMLRNLLETRFQMRSHRETKELPIYALVVANGGPKISPVVNDTAATAGASEQLAVIRSNEGKDGFPTVSLRAPGLVIETRNGRARITAKDVPLTRLADMLTGQVGRPVFDRTGLAGNYSFDIYFTPEGTSGGDSPEPSIFEAVREQLGLRLEGRKGPVEFLVIDHAEKVPTEN